MTLDNNFTAKYFKDGKTDTETNTTDGFFFFVSRYSGLPDTVYTACSDHPER